MCGVQVTIPQFTPISAEVESPASAIVEVLSVGIMDTTTPYEGAYEVVPTGDYQTIHIDGMKAMHDIVIDPIPSNYGLITWSGNVLTVS